ncbi:hypothetical protein GLE_1962 [Lysobacter enzymogenes]|uniref:Uncharacterized protein n=1 Tax=Lysobacter enzymogenes TaxID=69 RepID=A0A0S2DFK8_LYSEN|nr:hypothetical protein [Lysobacter enzymogenes]ALN57313.1 hypothetical protein GLE_1962 [Lysobacter enzymogenes]QCW25943.1 hypothetical protein FE772_09970 [Lysobacter enzymogenes]UZW58942.1 hypothetical protein BV903_016695 [Lysobacter enzymogenes]
MAASSDAIRAHRTAFIDLKYFLITVVRARVRARAANVRTHAPQGRARGVETESAQAFAAAPKR